jgi:hypothetical protein
LIEERRPFASFLPAFQHRRPGTFSGAASLCRLTTNEDFMAKDEHNKASEHHESAAKSRRSAA